MITLTEFSRSAASARAGRMLYEDLALVAHLSELERSASEAKRENGIQTTGFVLVAGFRRFIERTLSVFRPHSPASAK